MALRVGTSSGIYYAARDVELYSAIRKVGYTLTRGGAAMEIAVDVAHEVNYTQGREIRHIAKKQGVQLNLHGDLQVPFCIPERGEWRDAHDRLTKSIRSAILLGAHYVNFHACLNIWLELMTYTGRKLSASYCDGEGNFWTSIMKDEKTLEWFTRKKSEEYQISIFSPDEQRKISTETTLEITRQFSELLANRLKKIGLPDDLITAIITSNRALGRDDEETARVREIINDVNEEQQEKRSVISKEVYFRNIKKKILNDEPWFREELREGVGMLDGYHVMAHHMYFTQDPLWVAMANQYKDTLAKYEYVTGDPDWLERSWRKAEAANDREYKEFFYAAVGAKFLEGHLKKAWEWLHKEFIPKEIPQMAENKEEAKELTEIAKNLIIGLENPDARETHHAGLYYLFRYKQIYAAVKTIRKTLKTDKLFMVLDHEHVATQGIDALEESRRFILKTPDFGALTISCHSNHPNPLQPHAPLELGDVVLYELIYNLRVTGFGVGKQPGYMIFERGGGQDPFVKSIDALRLMAQFLEKDPPVPVDKLPLEFFGMKGLTGGDVQRQEQIVREHAFEPMKDLLEIPEEEWTMLSQTVIKKGKRPEVWKRGEFR